MILAAWTSAQAAERIKEEGSFAREAEIPQKGARAEFNGAALSNLKLKVIIALAPAAARALVA